MVASIRPKDLLSASNLTAGDRMIIDGATARSITVENFLSGTTQNFIGTGSITVATTDGTVAVNKTVGAPTTVMLPAAAAKIGPVLITDLKGDAGTNNITIVPNGTEKIQGQSTYTIGSDGGSLFLRPIPGVGYVI
jgi:hypothetical protein